MVEQDEPEVCPVCADERVHSPLALELTPKMVHYGRMKCPVCNHHGHWVTKPESEPTKYRRPKDTTNLASKAYCEICLRTKEQLPNKRALEGHHVIPVHAGGTSEPNNIWTLCTGCHRLLEWVRKYHS